ncbi:hypothetical protein ACFL6U_16415 [Planctomycetota bacterium]
MGATGQSSWLGDHSCQEIFRSFRMAIHPRKMVAAFSAVTVIFCTGWLMDISRSVAVNSRGDVTELHVYAETPDRVLEFRTQCRDNGQRAGVFATLARFGSERFHETLYSWFRIEQLQTVALPETVAFMEDCFQSVGWAFRYHTLYSAVFFSVVLLVLSVAGGAICRMAALQFSQDERPGLIESLHYSFTRWRSLVAAFLIPLAVIFFVGLFVFVLGLLGNIPWLGELIVAVGMPLVLGAGALIVFCFLGVIAGGGLMHPAVAYEDSESFTAINNAFRYVYSRPWRLGFYGIVAAGYGAVTYIFIRLFAFGLLLAGYRFMQLGMLNGNAKLHLLWHEPHFVDLAGPMMPAAEGVTLVIAAFLMRVCVLGIAGLVVAYAVSFYYSVYTVIYALMRHHVDGVPYTQIHTRPEAIEPAIPWPPTPVDKNPHDEEDA